MKSLVGTIYLITNKINDKKYIGQTWNTLRARFNSHASTNSSCVKLKNAILRHGKDKFKISTLMHCYSQDEMDFWEEFYITKYNSINVGYNLKKAGAKGQHSIETLKKLSESHKGLKISNEAKKKISLTHKGKRKPDGFGHKISMAKKGKSTGLRSAETKQKISLALKNRIMSDDQKTKLSKAAIYKTTNKISISDTKNIKKLKEFGLSTKDISIMYDISESYCRGILNGNSRNEKAKGSI